MSYTDYLGEIFKFIGFPVLISIGVTAYAKNNYDKKLEKVKLKNAKKLSDFQYEIDTLKSKENFKFTKLHEKRLKVLQKTYQYLNENLSLLTAHTAVVKFTPNGEDYYENEQKASEQYREAHNNFLKYFNHNAIYFDEEIENLIRSFFKETSEIFNLYDKKLIYQSTLAYKKIPEIIYPLKKEIEIKFRELLGE